MNNSLKRKVFDSCVRSVLKYEAAMSTKKKASENKVKIAQRAMERGVLEKRAKMTNHRIHQQTKVFDVIERITSLKWNWAGHNARMTAERWTIR